MKCGKMKQDLGGQNVGKVKNETGSFPLRCSLCAGVNTEESDFCAVECVHERVCIGCDILNVLGFV